MKGSIVHSLTFTLLMVSSGQFYDEKVVEVVATVCLLHKEASGLLEELNVNCWVKVFEEARVRSLSVRCLDEP